MCVCVCDAIFVSIAVCVVAPVDKIKHNFYHIKRGCVLNFNTNVIPSILHLEEAREGGRGPSSGLSLVIKVNQSGPSPPV